MHPLRKRLFLIQFSLFILTLLTSTLAGAENMFGNSFIFGDKPLGLKDFFAGLNFSIPFIAILTCHEFGHYFAAKKHKTRTTLPYYLPIWIPIFPFNIGTLGAFIRIKQKVKTTIKLFDIGIAGPIAGFIAALIVLWYGFTFLPPAEHIFFIHPDYAKFGLDYGKFVYPAHTPQNPLIGAINLGDSILFKWFRETFANPRNIPHPNEMTHYPYILAGHLALFFTSLNLMPIGQLDGGHILYGLIGEKRFNQIVPVFFLGFLFYAGLGMFSFKEYMSLGDKNDDFIYIVQLLIFFYFNYLCCSRITLNIQTNALIATTVVLLQLGISDLYPNIEGYDGFLLFALLLGRFLGIYHPPAKVEQPLNLWRKVLGWLALIIFVLCFSPKPLYFV
jgi:membrane-associated protease RseP (regulator of RpoE activity)